MKKIIVVIIALLMGVVAFGQESKREIVDSFKQGCFYLVLNDDADILFFSVDFDTAVRDYNTREIVSGVFKSNATMDFDKRANEWFVKKLKEENGELVLRKSIMELTNIVIGDDIVINDDGSISVTMTLLK